MSWIVGDASSSAAIRWVLGQALWLRLLGSAGIILLLSLGVSAVLAAWGPGWCRPANIASSVGIATGLAFVVWSVETKSGSMAVYQFLGGALALVVRSVAVSNRFEVLGWLATRADKLSYRIVYVALAVLLALPFVVGHWEAKPRPRQITRGLFNAIEKCGETGKPVFLLNAWIMDSRGENQPQFEVLVDHMMRRRVKFIMLSFFPDTALVGRAICQRTEAYYNKKFGPDYIKYGRDWLMLGYRPIYQTNGWLAWAPLMKTKGIVGAFMTDYQEEDLWKYPIMERPEAALEEERQKEAAEGKAPPEKPANSSETETPSGEGDEESATTESQPGTGSTEETGATEEASKEGEKVDTSKYLQIGDFGLLLEVHFTGTVEQIIGLIRLDKDLEGPDRKPKIMVALGTVNMVVNQMLPYYDSHDLAGILAGVQGAAEYSELLQAKYGTGPSREGVRQRVNPYSMGVLFVLSVIIVGNLSTLWQKLTEGREPRGVDRG
jgi:hypothetical protein